MCLSLIAAHPFGAQITSDSLLAQFSHFRQWEERYRQLILLGKRLPALPDELKNETTELKGCENRVWLGHQLLENGRLHFYGDSEGRIVRGLLAVLLTAVEGKTPQEVSQQDPLSLFAQLSLKEPLSASRSAGLQALADAVLQAANSYRG
ncbi:cysteine desulfurase sulfur acceptor subunit CsdE [Erwinia pyrifoliae]|uniref:Cysteine desulfurase sulfur acceptor subunit CsdE n=1 Tax=Erwinia pyrifoliae TaxID=79967 RepID=A0ABY5X9Z1_ERWPY|nr:cysteine desulfurase sulfur acceptor subunit CsdE [Erwinia pyrifoliae]UWS30049.1 cysteine desulfurase sulfur acceptor subunit CsdE [Erwinia pyrifoliae]UWS34216.1 cysteine desulfurase sulfur acceptor subunit CsdE [Erwinia pyrifoliae]UXK13065.1 cysteine desulfurase sulfur acceptor subunit CsdE [Erwinia pyrifoliae]